MDAINVYEHLIMGGKKAQNSIESNNNSKDLGHYVRGTRQTVYISKQEIQVCSNITLTLKWHCFTSGYQYFQYIPVRLFYFPTVWPAGLWTRKSLSAGHKKPHDKSLRNQKEQLRRILAVYLQRKSACSMPLCS